MHLERPAVDGGQRAVGVGAVVERVVVDPHARRRPDRDVVVRGVPVAGGRVGRVPDREAVVGVGDRQVPQDHVVGVADPQARADDPGVVTHADERDVRADVLERLRRLHGGGGDAGVLERAARPHSAPGPGRVEVGDVVGHPERPAAVGDGHLGGEGVARGGVERGDGAGHVDDAGDDVAPGIGLAAAGSAGEGVAQLLPGVHDVHLGRRGIGPAGGPGGDRRPAVRDRGALVRGPAVTEREHLPAQVHGGGRGSGVGGARREQECSRGQGDDEGATSSHETSLSPTKGEKPVSPPCHRISGKRNPCLGLRRCRHDLAHPQLDDRLRERVDPGP